MRRFSIAYMEKGVQDESEDDRTIQRGSMRLQLNGLTRDRRGVWYDCLVTLKTSPDVVDEWCE
jgi:hypothetical protein